MTQYRQGDVLVTQIDTIPADVAPVKDTRVILAHGEVTGHCHEVMAEVDVALPPAQLFEAPDGSRYLLVERPCVLTHQEHGPIPLAPGAYRVTRQREYSPEAIRTVGD